MKNIIYICILVMTALMFQNCTNLQKLSRVEAKTNEFMEIRGYYQIEEGINFYLEAKRIDYPEVEYFPSSENFRVEIYDENANLIFNSNYNQDYLMSIMRVLPEEQGETHKYHYNWNYKNNKGHRVNPGKYTVNLILPAEPAQYTLTLDLEITQ